MGKLRVEGYYLRYFLFQRFKLVNFKNCFFNDLFYIYYIILYLFLGYFIGYDICVQFLNDFYMLLRIVFCFFLY